MRIGIWLRFRVFIVTFRGGFNGVLFVSIALAAAEAFVNFDRSESMSHEADFAVEPDDTLTTLTTVIKIAVFVTVRAGFRSKCRYERSRSCLPIYYGLQVILLRN